MKRASPQSTSKRTVFGRGEVISLIGFVLVVMSGSLVWQRALPPGIPGAAIYMTEVSTTGFDLKVGAIRVGLAAALFSLLPAMLLLFEPKPANRTGFLVSSIIASGCSFIIAVRFLSPQPGVMLAFVGAGMLLTGSILRYRP